MLWSSSRDQRLIQRTATLIREDHRRFQLPGLAACQRPPALGLPQEPDQLPGQLRFERHAYLGRSPRVVVLALPVGADVDVRVALVLSGPDLDPLPAILVNHAKELAHLTPFLCWERLG